MSRCAADCTRVQLRTIAYDYIISTKCTRVQLRTIAYNYIISTKCLYKFAE